MVSSALADEPCRFQCFDDVASFCHVLFIQFLARNNKDKVHKIAQKSEAIATNPAGKMGDTFLACYRLSPAVLGNLAQ